MERERPAYARLVRDARRRRDWTLDSLAARLHHPVTRAHLSDIERGARYPSVALMDDLAATLDLPADYYCFLLGRWPSDLRGMPASPERVGAAFEAFRRVLACECPRTQPKGDAYGQ